MSEPLVPGSGPEGLPPPDPRMTRRARSLTLRTEGEQGDPGAMMDAAHRSLSDAIRVVLRLVQLAMLVLAVLYVLSGFQSVKEGEQGIRLVFGAPRATNLDPGFRFSYPPPIGELVKVQTGAEKITLDSEFWVFLADQKARETPVDSLPKMNHLAPDRDGSVITGDGNLAHTRWQVTFQRARPDAFARTMLPEVDSTIIRAAVKRGVVQACAETGIEELLKQGSAEGIVSRRATEVAQQMLDHLGTGVVIERLVLEEKMPPLYVREKFAAVQSAAANAGKAGEDARASADQALKEVAGEAAPSIVRLVGIYEDAIDRADAALQSGALGAIDDVLEGREGAAGDVRVRAGAASGSAISLLAEARQYRSEVVSQRRSDLTRFRAKLEQFRSNPLVMVHREWAEALTAFYSRDNVQVMLVPPGTRVLEIVLNADPDIVRALDKARKLREAESARADREARQQQDKFKVDRGLKVRGD